MAAIVGRATDSITPVNNQDPGRLRMVEDILRQEFGSRDFQFQDIGQGGSNFVFQVGFDDQHYVLRICSQRHPIINDFSSLRSLEGLDIAPKAVRCNQWNQLYYAIETFLPGKHESNSDQNVPILLQTATEIHQVHSDRCGHLGRLNHCSWSAYVHDMARGNERHFLEKVPDQKYIGCVLTGYPEAANFSLLHGDL